MVELIVDSIGKMSVPIVPAFIVEVGWQVVHYVRIKKMWEFLDCAVGEQFEAGVEVCD